jgi:hypothetical protein
MALIDDVKVANRIMSMDPGITKELEDLIESALLDLNITGVKVDQEPIDPLIKRAVIIYTKLHFGFDNSDYERLEKSYTMLKQHLSLAGEYIATLE